MKSISQKPIKFKFNKYLSPVTTVFGISTQQMSHSKYVHVFFCLSLLLQMPPPLRHTKNVPLQICPCVLLLVITAANAATSAAVLALTLLIFRKGQIHGDPSSRKGNTHSLYRQTQKKTSIKPRRSPSRLHTSKPPHLHNSTRI